MVHSGALHQSTVTKPKLCREAKTTSSLLSFHCHGHVRVLQGILLRVLQRYIMKISLNYHNEPNAKFHHHRKENGKIDNLSIDISQQIDNSGKLNSTIFVIIITKNGLMLAFTAKDEN